MIKYGYAIWLAGCLTIFYDIRMDEWRFWIMIIGLGISMGFRDAYEEEKSDRYE